MVIVITAAITDLISRKIPNWLILIGLIGGIGINIYEHLTIKEALFRLAIIVVILLLGTLRMLGMGDIKLWIVLTILIGGMYSSMIICIASILLVLFAIAKDGKKALVTAFVSASDVIINKKINKEIKEISNKGYPLAVFMVFPTAVFVALGLAGVLNV